jgi:hypothetical protein
MTSKSNRNNRNSHNTKPNSNPLGGDSSEEDEVKETQPESTLATVNLELQKQIEELKHKVEVVSAASGSSISSVTTTSNETETGSVAGMELPEGKRQLVRTFVREVAWKMVKFVPDDDKVFEISKELLPQLLKYCPHITTLKDN